MVDVLGPLLVFCCLPQPGGLADVVVAGVEVERGHADLGEVELVGAVEEALVGELVRHQHAALPRGQRLRDRVERGLAEADLGEVAACGRDVAAVEVDVGGDLAGREGGVRE